MLLFFSRKIKCKWLWAKWPGMFMKIIFKRTGILTRIFTRTRNKSKALCTWIYWFGLFISLFRFILLRCIFVYCFLFLSLFSNTWKKRRRKSFVSENGLTFLLSWHNFLCLKVLRKSLFNVSSSSCLMSVASWGEGGDITSEQVSRAIV